MRIMVAHLNRKIGNLGGTNVGRIGYDQIERAGERCGIIASDECGASRQADLICVGAGGQERGNANVGTYPKCVREFGQQRQQDRAGAGAEIGDAKRRIAPRFGPQSP